MKVEVIKKENVVPIVMTPYKEIIPSMAVLLQSIIENSSKDHFYDIIAIHNEVEAAVQIRLVEWVNEIDNFSLRFVDISEYAMQYAFFQREMKKQGYIATYFRLFIPELLADYPKAIYIDTDTVVNVDLARLIETDLDGFMIAGARDLPGNRKYYDNNSVKEYRDKVLKLRYPDNYFNAGVLVFNISEFLSNYTKKEWWDMVNSHPWKSHDQDILNSICNEKVYILSYAWNYIEMGGAQATGHINREDIDDMVAAAKDVHIIHYTGRFKPWNYFQVPFFDVFWDYAKRSPYFEDAFNMIGVANMDQKIIELSQRGKISIKVLCICMKKCLMQRVKTLFNR